MPYLWQPSEWLWPCHPPPVPATKLTLTCMCTHRKWSKPPNCPHTQQVSFQYFNIRLHYTTEKILACGAMSALLAGMFKLQQYSGSNLDVIGTISSRPNVLYGATGRRHEQHSLLREPLLVVVWPSPNRFASSNSSHIANHGSDC